MEYHKIHTLFKRDEAKRIIPSMLTLPEFDYLRSNTWEWTEKVDGTNIRVYWDGETVTFNGRTGNAIIPKPLMAKLVELFPVEKLAVCSPCCLYGEGYGAGIQSGGGYGPVNFVLFDVRVDKQWLSRCNVDYIAKTLGIESVPVVGSGTLDEAIQLVAIGFKSQRWPGVESEGLVVRPIVELQNKYGERIITKIKTRDFKSLSLAA